MGLNILLRPYKDDKTNITTKKNAFPSKEKSIFFDIGLSLPPISLGVIHSLTP